MLYKFRVTLTGQWAGLWRSAAILSARRREPRWYAAIPEAEFHWPRRAWTSGGASSSCASAPERMDECGLRREGSRP